jgi:hypothetical protein
LVGAENDRPSLEVRFRSDGHPPFTEREREIHLNGISGVKFKTRIEKSIRVFLFPQKTSNAERPTPNVELRADF